VALETLANSEAQAAEGAYEAVVVGGGDHLTDDDEHKVDPIDPNPSPDRPKP